MYKQEIKEAGDTQKRRPGSSFPHAIIKVFHTGLNMCRGNLKPDTRFYVVTLP
jgi:hypothetical protein